MHVLAIPLVCIFAISLLESPSGFSDIYDWIKIKRDLVRKMSNIKLMNKRQYSMDFIEAQELTKTGVRVRRKSWAQGKENAWQKNPRETSREMWWDSKYESLMAGAPDRHEPENGKYLDTDGWIYVCRGDDVSGTDWEQC